MNILFRYIFWELLKIFFLAASGMAGIMSFGALLRPLTKQGLGLGEVIQVVMNLMPAMSTYSLPIAALFATTLVYGRLAAENELTAMRASGLSHLWVAAPGFMLGCIVALLSVFMLCFVVPASTLRVERVIYSNVARVLATSIERTHEFELTKEGQVLSAQGARILPPDPNDPTKQTVILDSPLIITNTIEMRDGEKYKIPRDFYTARTATVQIKPVEGTEEVEVVAFMGKGVSFPRRPSSAVTGGVEETQFGPIRQMSQLVEKAKFMNLARLQTLFRSPETAHKVVDAVAQTNRAIQQQLVLTAINSSIQAHGLADFASTDGDRYTLTARNTKLTAGEAVFRYAAPPGATVRLENSRGLTIDASAVSIRLNFDESRKIVEVEMTFDDAAFRSAPDEELTNRPRFRRSFLIAMPEEVLAAGKRTAAMNSKDPALSEAMRFRVNRALLIVRNEVIGELNSRAAFALSCLILVVMGVTLGMMFRSGHFLTAFAISVVPALVCILLNVTGQHTLENIPGRFPPGWTNPLAFGLAMIWSGNAAVLAGCAVLLHRLNRQ